MLIASRGRERLTDRTASDLPGRFDQFLVPHCPARHISREANSQRPIGAGTSVARSGFMGLLQKGVEAMLFLLGAIFAVLLVGEIIDPDYVLRALLPFFTSLAG